MSFEPLDQSARFPERFDGRARLFPLPNLVLFPHVVQALHIFEPRYRALLKQALEGDQLIAMAVLRPGCLEQYEGDPPVEPHVCVGKIISHSPLPDGRANILLLGMQRAEIVRELPKQHAFREAEVRLLDDLYPPGGAERRADRQRQLLEAYQAVLPGGGAAEQIEKLVGKGVSLGMMTDIAAYSFDFPLQFKLQLLAEQDVDRRAELLVSALASRSGDPEFPPDFSDN